MPWYRTHHRDLPWRRTSDPYLVWLSEVILQQTRVDQGLPYYLRFAQRYPTVGYLARTSEVQVLKLWQGLGYYSRARNLLVAARQVMRDHGGQFPTSSTALLGLKGVGDYTAAAIASICGNEQVAVVDGNVYRVLSRVFGIDTPIDRSQGRSQFRALATELVDHRAPGDHNQAVMELGAQVCRPRDPDCAACPLRTRCVAHREGRTAFLPVKAKRQASRVRYFNYLHIPSANGLYLQKRSGNDIWRGLYELPVIESDRPLTKATMARRCSALLGPRWRVARKDEVKEHVLSHQRIRAVFWEVGPPANVGTLANWKLVTHTQLHRYPVPRLIERWMEEHLRSSQEGPVRGG